MSRRRYNEAFHSATREKRKYTGENSEQEDKVSERDETMQTNLVENTPFIEIQTELILLKEHAALRVQTAAKRKNRRVRREVCFVVKGATQRLVAKALILARSEFFYVQIAHIMRRTPLKPHS